MDRKVLTVLRDVLANEAEGKVAPVPGQVSAEGDEHFPQRRVDIKEEPAAEVVAGKLSKVDLIEPSTSRRSIQEIKQAHETQGR